MADSIALTTIFTPPASCLGNSYTSYGPTVYVKDIKVESAECYPDGFQALWSVGSTFSPGVCPDSYVTASQGSLSGNGEVTAALCCPQSMTAHDGELGCYAAVDTQTVLALPTGVVTVQNAMLAVHGVYVAWAESDLSVLPATPGSSSLTALSRTSSSSSSTEQSETPTPPSTSVPVTLTMTSDADSTTVTLRTTIEATTRESKPPTTESVSDLISTTLGIPLDAVTPTSPSEVSTTGASPASTAKQAQGLPAGTVAGISIGAFASLALFAGLITMALLARRRRRRRRPEIVDVRVSDTTSQFQDDKRRWSSFLSPAVSEVPGSTPGGSDVLSEADSRIVVSPLAELQGN